MHDLFVQHAADLELAIAWVCRRTRLNTDRDDFEQDVRTHILRTPQILTAFRADGRLSSYLRQVVWRFFLDWHRHRHGRWRPSAKARSLGPIAVLLERSSECECSSMTEAVDRLSAKGVATRNALLGLATSRRTRRLPNDIRSLSQGRASVVPRAARDDVADREYADRVKTWLRGALCRMTAENRSLLLSRFGDRKHISALAEASRKTPKQIYARLARILRDLRASANDEQIDAMTAADLLERQLFADLDFFICSAEPGPARTRR